MSRIIRDGLKLGSSWWNEWSEYWYLETKIVFTWRSGLPSQLSPFFWNPSLQLHVYDPSRFWHTFSFPHMPWLFSHSLISTVQFVPVQPSSQKHPVTGSHRSMPCPQVHIWLQSSPKYGSSHSVYKSTKIYCTSTCTIN